jgi:hypothetical protein
VDNIHSDFEGGQVYQYFVMLIVESVAASLTVRLFEAFGLPRPRT